jgi:general secretion pathway protein A
MIGEDTHHVMLPQLRQHWDGDFEMLWRPPQLDIRNLSLGMQGEPVLELRSRLRQWAGLAPDTAGSDVYDDALFGLVLQFQRRNGLSADGVAGSRTRAMLDAALAPLDSPLLSAALP